MYMTKKQIEKIYNKLRKKYTDEEIADAYLFPPLKRPRKEQEKLDKEFGEAIAKIRANRTPEEILDAKMFRLKLQMQDYVQSNKYDDGKRFSFFLTKYIEMLEKKNKDFAKDISITAVELSQLLNNHRNPNIKILIRLELHSNNGIPAYLWFKVLEKEKEHEIINNKELRKQETKYVRNIVKLAS
jgi:transcriptional regulator with XRE-family HTH domain